MTDNRYADYDDRGRSEYGRAGDGDRIKPNGVPRPLSTAERARAVRSAGLRPNTDTDLGDTGVRVA
jgi:hypothetical protein